MCAEKSEPSCLKNHYYEQKYKYFEKFFEIERNWLVTKNRTMKFENLGNRVQKSMRKLLRDFCVSSYR